MEGESPHVDGSVMEIKQSQCSSVIFLLSCDFLQFQPVDEAILQLNNSMLVGSIRNR